MDEMKAMTHAGETVGKAVGTGLRSLRLGAGRAEETAGPMNMMPADLLPADDAAPTGRRARRDMARAAKAAAKDAAVAAAMAAAVQAKAARGKARRAKKASDLPEVLAEPVAEPKRRGRRWPWLLVLGVAAAGTVYVLKSRRSAAPVTELTDEDHASEMPRRTPAGMPEDRTERRSGDLGDGMAPEPRQSATDGHAHRRN